MILEFSDKTGQVRITAHDHHMVFPFEAVVRIGHEHGTIRFPDAENTDIIIDPDIQFFNAFPHPLFERENLIDPVISQIYKIKNMVRTGFFRNLLGNVALRIDDLIRPVPQKKFCLYIRTGAADDPFCPQLL